MGHGDWGQGGTVATSWGAPTRASRVLQDLREPQPPPGSDSRPALSAGD